MSQELQRALERLAVTRVLLVACDFDGTLSPIVANPAAAEPDPEALRALTALADLPRTPVLVLSGRGWDDLARRMGAPHDGIRLVGSHGAEAGPADDRGESPGIAVLLAALDLVASRFPESELEVKPHSVAFHYRRVGPGDQRAARQAAVEAARKLSVEVRPGKKVVEFMTVRSDKGSALERFRSECGAEAVVFVGDDVTDEAAFRVLAPGDVGVKVGPEPTAAAFRVSYQGQVAALLSRLLQLRTRRLRD